MLLLGLLLMGLCLGLLVLLDADVLRLQSARLLLLLARRLLLLD